MAAASERSGAEFKPYIPSEKKIPEFTFKAIVLGVFFGILFGAATVYLALRAGLTVSASVPIAVLAIAVFKKIGKSTILENNIVQTIGSAGRIGRRGRGLHGPGAPLSLGRVTKYFQYLQITILAIFGGILGVLFMIPLRRALIVKEHGKLPYPEGDRLRRRAHRRREGRQPREDGLRRRRRRARSTSSSTGSSDSGSETPIWFRTRRNPRPTRRATLDVDVTPEYLGLGYIIGPRIASELFSGGLLSWLALIPLIAIFVPETRRHRRPREPRLHRGLEGQQLATRTGSTAPTSATSARAPSPAPAS